jgi:hypothetical protein
MTQAGGDNQAPAEKAKQFGVGPSGGGGPAPLSSGGGLGVRIIRGSPQTQIRR